MVGKNPTLIDVRYDPNDPVIGQFMAWSSMLPIFLVVAFAAIIVVKRELQFLAFVASLLVSEVVNLILKHSIQEPRPHGSYMTGYGMPSSHAQFMTFVATYGLLHLWLHLSFHFEKLVKPTLTVIIMNSTFAVCVSRVYLGVHSLHQVEFMMI